MLVANVKSTHDRITLTVKNGKVEDASLRYNRYSDSGSGSGVTKETMNTLLNKWNDARTNSGQKMGEIAERFKQVAETCSTIAEFAAKVTAKA